MYQSNTLEILCINHPKMSNCDTRYTILILKQSKILRHSNYNKSCINTYQNNTYVKDYIFSFHNIWKLDWIEIIDGWCWWKKKWGDRKKMIPFQVHSFMYLWDNVFDELLCSIYYKTFTITLFRICCETMW